MGVQLRQRLLSLDRLQRHTRLERRAVVAAWSLAHLVSHHATAMVAVRQKIHSSQCSILPGHLSSDTSSPPISRSSVNPLRFIVCPSFRPDSNRSWRKIRRSHQESQFRGRFSFNQLKNTRPKITSYFDISILTNSPVEKYVYPLGRAVAGYNKINGSGALYNR